MDSKRPTFSRAGRFCDERYNTEVTEARVLGTSSKPFIRLESKPEKVQTVEEVINEANADTSPKISKKPKGTPAFLTQSREDFQRVKNKRDSIPGAGYYTICYDSRFKRPSAPIMKSPQSPTSPKFEGSPSRQALELSAQKQSSMIVKKRGGDDRKKVRARTAVDFKKQMGRDDYRRVVQSPHEKRFESAIEIPEVSTMHKRVVSPRIAGYLPRDNSTFATNLSLAQYYPNFDCVSPKSIRNVDFNKCLGRKALRREFSSLEYDYINHKSIKPDRSVPDFSKTTARPSLKFLPSFMHSTCSRLAIQHLNHKTLEMNNFAEGDLVASYSSFQSPKSRGMKMPVSPKHSRIFKFD
mmetsp:Transcript_19099/g.34740  ORF Transcript_19099/g.34740 Transcript_19099/m.34740 type:complete len:353 (+) Transcript_19099:1009-2067(+)